MVWINRQLSFQTMHYALMNTIKGEDLFVQNIFNK